MTEGTKFDSLEDADSVLTDAARRIGDIFGIVMGTNEEGDTLNFVTGDLTVVGEAATLDEIKDGTWMAEFANRAFIAALMIFAKGV